MAAILDVSAASASDDAINVVAATVMGDAWKGAWRNGQTYVFRTSRTSAACGLNPAVGDVWLLFSGKATRDEWLHSCNGSRALRAAGESAPFGFKNVPGRFVAGQLNALAGLDVLRQLHTSVAPELIGLLDIKSLAHGARVPVFADASAASSVIAEVECIDELMHREASYEYPAAEVYGVTEFGYRLRLAAGNTGRRQARCLVLQSRLLIGGL